MDPNTPVHACAARHLAIAFFSWLLCAGLNCAMAEALPPPSEPTAPAAPTMAMQHSLQPHPDSVVLCQGHVSGAPSTDGSSPSHISWSAYTNPQDPAVLADFYANSFRASAEHLEAICAIWRFPADKPTRVLQVCPIASKGPWSHCLPLPMSAKSIILISEMTRP